MSLQRELSKRIAEFARKATPPLMHESLTLTSSVKVAKNDRGRPSQTVPAHPSPLPWFGTPSSTSANVSSKRLSALRQLFDSSVRSIWWRYFRIPYERWQMMAIARYLREHGLMYDDMYSTHEPIVERALEMLPEDIAAGLCRRKMRAIHLNTLRLYLPLSEQNYDPFLPYLAPYVEEAKFQLQEEEELLGYHMCDRRFFSGSTVGLGDHEPGMHFLVSFPNMYGAGGGLAQKKHFSSLPPFAATRGNLRSHAVTRQFTPRPA
eukprot:GHVT01069233.1.p1 GENE.GHVT01069233.1~~GHVT01069233.1.p1  ORF type:complete len:263 (-),score=16.87 GHVT01069233.1:143-931(-)